jgi:hypothetical protein
MFSKKCFQRISPSWRDELEAHQHRKVLHARYVSVRRWPSGATLFSRSIPSTYDELWRPSGPSRALLPRQQSGFQDPAHKVMLRLAIRPYKLSRTRFWLAKRWFETAVRLWLAQTYYSHRSFPLPLILGPAPTSTPLSLCSPPRPPALSLFPAIPGLVWNTWSKKVLVMPKLKSQSWEGRGLGFRV